ncbi:transposable element Tcb2 transposase [Trichonephila clavipes]|nr:transposable element Tcb2 transposase [Trichonephila clavipes]
MDDFLETGNIQRMSWPANSPDLNPIEDVWDMLRRLISASSHPTCSVTELKRALQEAWNRLSPQLIHHLIASMAFSGNLNRVGQRCTLNLSRAETSSRWCGVVVKGGASSGVVHVT